MECVIFIGAQATGKSTFCAARFAQTHLRLSLDMLRTRHREQILVQACLAAKQPFVVDNTNPTREERARYIGWAQAARFRVAGYWFEAPFDAMVARNAGRSGRARVPDVALRATLKKLQPPSFDEGFEALWRVRPGAGPGDFLTEELSREL